MGRKLWAGLDVGVETTSVCIIDDLGEILQESTCPSTLQGIDNEIRWLRRRRFARVGVEASTSSAIVRGLRSRGYCIDAYETRRLSKFLRVRRNKTDAGDALGIAEVGRIGPSLVPKVHMKNLECQSLQSRLLIRKFLIQDRVAAMSLLCRQLELYGGRIRKSQISMRFRSQVEAELRKVFGRHSSPLVLELRRLLDHCERLLIQQQEIDRELGRLCREHEPCSRFLQIPGVGPICALTFYAALGEAGRFARSSDVGPYLGLTPTLYESGMTRRVGRISKQGNRAARTALVQSSIHFMRHASPDSAIRSWAARIERERGRKKARVALARKLAIIMLAMWKSGECFSDTRLAAIVVTPETKADTSGA